VHVHAHLDGNDAGETGLSETGWTGQQQVISGLTTHLRRFEDDAEVLLQLSLADELAEPPRPQTGFVGLFDVVGG